LAAGANGSADVIICVYADVNLLNIQKILSTHAQSVLQYAL